MTKKQNKKAGNLKGATKQLNDIVKKKTSQELIKELAEEKKTQKVVVDGAQVTVDPDKKYSNGKTGKEIIEENGKKVKPKTEKPVSKKVIGAKQVLEAIAEKPVLVYKDSANLIAVKYAGKVLTYITDTKQGISFYRRSETGNWLATKYATKKELTAVINELEQSMNQPQAKPSGHYVPIKEFLKEDD